MFMIELEKLKDLLLNWEKSDSLGFLDNFPSNFVILSLEKMHVP